MAHSTLYELLAVKLGKDPVQDMTERRSRGTSWRGISLAYLTEHGVDVTDTTLRSWFRAASQEQEQSA